MLLLADIDEYSFTNAVVVVLDPCSLSHLLTHLWVDVLCLVELNVFALIEEVLVDTLTSEEPDVTVIRHSSCRLIGQIQIGTLRLSFHGRDDERNTKQPQQILRKENTYSASFQTSQ